MEARFLRLAVLAATFCSMGAGYRTANFVVTAPTPQMSEQIGKAAETYRKQLAIEWLGKEMPTWSQPCPVTAQVADHLGAGGATSFLFERGEVFGWQMTIQGSLERVLDSVLPHEVTHTIFATHFRQPLPRWADEGACTTVEHISERTKQQNMLLDFLRTGRGIAFSRMFAMKEYPHDVMPLYSQGYSLARYLLAQGGKQKFLAFVGDGMRDENWTRAINEHYGYKNLSALQNTWLGWVRQGSPPLSPGKNSGAEIAAAGNRQSRPDPNLIFRGQSPDRSADVASAVKHPAPTPEITSLASNGVSTAVDRYAPETSAPSPEAVARHSDPAKALQATRPQPVQKARQIILEWSKPPMADPHSTATTNRSSVYAQSVTR